MAVRQGESEKNWFRSERPGFVKGGDYFETRGGAVIQKIPVGAAARPVAASYDPEPIL